jgi:hypothetical protein
MVAALFILVGARLIERRPRGAERVIPSGKVT